MYTHDIIADVFKRFSDGGISSFYLVDTGRGEKDLRKTFIITQPTGKRMVIKLADNDFTFPEKIKMWQRTIDEYRSLGYYCPRIFADKTGEFPYIEYDGHRCVAYAEEYSLYQPLEQRNDSDEDNDALYDKYRHDIWKMTARIAAKHFDYTQYPSGYCLFERFCESDKTDEVLEAALEWKKYADTLPEMFRAQTDRIWRIWNENRSCLERVYHELPTSVFQADLNSTNILVDKDGRFAGVFDFNLCGREVFLNYLFRENYGSPENSLKKIFASIDIVKRYYEFSQAEKEYALMLFRCLKPLWFCCLEQLKECKDDTRRIQQFLDMTEHYLTCDIDLKSHMG